MANLAIRRSIMNRKCPICLLVFIALIAIFLGSCEGSNTKMAGEMPDGLIGGDENQKIPDGVPAGFIPLGKDDSNWENGLRYVFWETQISFLDADNVCIYQTSVENSDFIIKYGKDYYVNAEKFSEVQDVAATAPDIRRKTFSIGKAIGIRGDGDTVYTVKITSVKASKTGDVTTYTIKYTASSNDKNKAADFHFICLTETKDGITDNGFNYIGDNTVIEEIPKNRELGAIILTSPEYPGLTYKVVVD